MKNSTKITALFLIVILLVSSLPLNIFTAVAADTTEPTITVDTITATPASTVTVKLTVTNNPGILGMTLKLTYDDSIATLTNIESGDAMSALTFTKPRDLSSGCRLPFDALDLADEDIKDGTVAILTFDISASATSSDTVNINLSYDSGAIIDRDLNPLNVAIAPGKIQIVDYMPGDVNGDLIVNTTDVIYLRRHIAGGYNVTINVPAGDVNADSLLNTTDVIYIRRYIAGGYGVELKPSPLAGGGCVHEYEAVEEKAPTCTEDGNTAHWVCTKCDTYYKDANGESRITFEETVIAKTGHTEVTIPEVPPTYTESGYTAGVKCSVCDTIIVAPELIDPLETDEISIQYEYCTIAGDTYLENAIANAVSEEKIITQETQNTTDSSYTLPFIELNTIKGYEFQGWYTSTAADAEKVTVVTKGTVGSVKYFAKWTKSMYKVTFKSDLKELDPVDRTIDQTTYLPSAKAMEVPFYIFIGWSDASGRIITQINPGVENITVYANWTSSTRNVTIAENYEDEAPVILEDDEQYLFVYNIGTITNVPLVTIEDYGYSDYLTIDKTDFEEKTYGENEAKNVNTTVANATTHSSSWTLSEDWNELVTEMSGNEETVTEGTVIAVSDGSSTAYSSEGSTYIGNSFHASNSSQVTSKTITDDSWKLSAEVKAGVSAGPYKVEAGISGETAHSEHQEDYSESNSSLDVASEWNSTNGYSASSSSTHSSTRTASVLNEAKNTWKHEISRSLGGSSGTTSEESSSTTASDSFSSTIGFYNDTTSGSSITQSRVFDVPGFYRYVMYAEVHVYAAVGYDMKTGAYFVNTYSAIDDNLTYGFAYSTDGSYRDYDNGVLPFEVPVFVYDYIYERMSKTQGIIIDRNGTVTDYMGSATDVRIPDYACFDNQDGTYEVVPVTGIEPGVFEDYTAITSVRLSKYITAIPEDAFKGCSSLVTIEHGTLNSIGKDAFNGCVSLEKFEITKSITSLGETAFDGVIEVVAHASTADVAASAISCGAKKLSVYLDFTDTEVAAFSNKDLVTGENTTSLFALYGNGKSFDNVSIDSNANKTIINRITFANNSKTPLTINSESVEFFAVNIIDAPGIALHFCADNTSLIITGINTVSSKGNAAMLTKGLTVSLPANISETTKMTVSSGNVYVCGEIETLVNFKYFVGEIVSITEEEYQNYLDTHYIHFDANGGTVSTESMAILWNAEIGTLPTPTYSGLTFLGWFDENGEKVTAGQIFTQTNDITVRAHWQTSDWVVASNVPSNATIISEKWKYTQREYTESSSSTLDGWIQSAAKITSWGSWSSWSKTAVSATDTRQVETKTVVDRAAYTNYRYYIYRTSDGYGYGTQNYNTNTSHGYCTIYDEINLTYELPVYNSSLGLYGPYNSSMFSHNSDSYWFYAGSSYVPEVSHTEYRYRNAVYTYYYYRDVSKEATYDPVNEKNVLSQTKYVKYVIE